MIGAPQLLKPVPQGREAVVPATGANMHSLEFMNHGEYFFKFMGLSNSYDLIHGVFRFIVTEFMAFLDS